MSVIQSVCRNSIALHVDELKAGSTEVETCFSVEKSTTELKPKPRLLFL